MQVEDIIKYIETLPHKEDGRVYITSLKPLIRDLDLCREDALCLWNHGSHGAREVAIRAINLSQMNEALIESWVKDLDSWDMTDALTAKVRYTPYAVSKAFEWHKREREFERRASFALIAQMAWEKNDFKDDIFLDFLPIIEDKASDNRLYVKKAVNWALRDIGKRNENLRQAAQSLAYQLQESDHSTKRWVGKHRFQEIA